MRPCYLTPLLPMILCCAAQSAPVERMFPVEMTATAWTQAPTHPAMVTDLLCAGTPIRYRLRVDPGERCAVVLGFVERYWQEPGKRLMDVVAEGAETTTVDVVKSVGPRAPLCLTLPCRDADDDGWLTVEIRPHPGAADTNPLLNALWLFDGAAPDTESLLAGKRDGEAIYMIDAGRPGSEIVEHDYRDDLARTFETALALQDEVKTHPERLARWTARVGEAQSRDGADSAVSARALIARIVALSSEMLPELSRIYSPAYDTAIETRMSSPWGATARLRHTESLDIGATLIPHADSARFEENSPQNQRSLIGQIGFIPDTPASHLSAALHSGYSLDLRKVDYDPLRTIYQYTNGRIVVQALCDSAIGVYGEGLRFRVRLEPGSMRQEGRLRYAAVDGAGGPVYVGVVTDSDKLESTAGRAAIVWADTMERLRAVASKVTRWSAARAQADRWAEKIDGGLRIDAPSPYPEMARLNRRALTSMQYKGGPSLAALDGGYTQVWVRDTTTAMVHAALAGDPSFLRTWMPYLFGNPTHETLDGKDYTVFWAFPTLHVEKQQDGQFYAARAAYAYWKLTGDASKLREWYPILRSAMEYQRAVYFDEKLGLYCEININEAALKEAGEWAIGEQFPALKIDGIWPVRSFDLYINNLMYATHLMLAEMAKQIGAGIDYTRNMRMARELASAIGEKLWDRSAGKYRCGLARMEDGRLLEFTWDYWDTNFDYVWANSLYPMTPNPQRSLASLRSMIENRKGPWPGGMYFAPGFAHASYVYASAGAPNEAARLLNVITEPSRGDGWNDEMGARYTMAGAIIENLAAPQLHRPQIFTIGPWLHAVVAQCVGLDCNGVTIVPGGIATGARGVEFRGAVLDVETGGIERPCGVEIDGKAIRGTLRIPSGALTPGRHRIRLLESSGTPGPTLAHTDFDLLDARSSQDSAKYKLNGYGTGVLRFTDLDLDAQVTDADGRPMPFTTWSDASGLRIQIDAGGPFEVSVKHRGGSR